MSYHTRIKILEDLYNETEVKIKALANTDVEQISTLTVLKNKYLIELKNLRRKQYELDQEVDLDDR